MSSTALGIVGGLVVGAALGFGAATVYKGNHAGENITLLEVDGTKYREADLPADIRSGYYDIKAEEHDRGNALLGQFALQLALAKDKDKNVKADALPPFDQLVEAPAPTEQELQALFEANKARLPPDATFEKIKPDIERFVRNQKLSETLRAKNDELSAKKRVVLLTPEPSSPKVTLVLDPYAAKGAVTASNTLVEVADYLCPHCQASEPEVEATVKELGDKYRFVHVPFSLRPEGLSGTLARGAFCAKQQGDEAFWKYHEKAFATAKEKGWKSTDPDSKDPVLEVATAAGIDGAKLEACLATPEAQAFVKNTTDSMHKAGVSGTPTFFLNGRRLSLSNKSLKDAVMGRLQAASH